MSDDAKVSVGIEEGVGRVSFYHPKKNSLPGILLRELAGGIELLGKNEAAKVVLLKSEGDGPFCAGASFDELLAIDSFEKGKEFFMGFARLILAMKKCPKFVIARVQGKTVGGGVGVAAAADYTLASDYAAVKLSELALGIGPFVVGPAVERKIGKGAFTALSIDAGWRDAAWAKHHGLYAETYSRIEELDEAVTALAQRLSHSSPDAMARLKAVSWEGTEHWEELLEARAELSGRLVLSDFTRQYIRAFKQEQK